MTMASSILKTMDHCLFSAANNQTKQLIVKRVRVAEGSGHWQTADIVIDIMRHLLQ